MLAFQKWRFFRVLKVHHPNDFKSRNSLANLFTALITFPLHVTSDPAVRGNLPAHSVLSAVDVVIIYLLEGGVLWWFPIQCLDRVRKV